MILIVLFLITLIAMFVTTLIGVLLDKWHFTIPFTDVLICLVFLAGFFGAGIIVFIVL